MRTGYLALTLSLGCLCLCQASEAGAEDPRQVLLRIDGVDAGSLETRGFELETDQVVRIQATDLEARSHTGEMTSAWILEGTSRRVVWRMGDSKPIAVRRGLPRYDDNVPLRAGTYEVYFATYSGDGEINEDDGWWQNASRALRRFAEEEILGREEYEEATQRLRLVVKGKGRELGDTELEQRRQALRRHAIVSLAPMGDNVSQENGFVLERPTDLVVYVLGELSSKERFDYGWIVDIRTRRDVWTFNRESSRKAGGGGKNRMAHHRLRLPAGRYGAYFRTDESHSAAEWNALPPLDPAFWGMTIWVSDPKQSQYVKRFQYQHLPKDRIMVQLTRIGNNQSVSRAFSLKEPVDVRFYALGEGTKNGMADYGQMIDAHTRETVWKMEFGRTTDAGGSSKNRKVDEIARLEAGDYIVTFVTDESHAFGHWYGKPPPRADRWGITLLGTGDFDPAVVKPYKEEADPRILARILQVRNSADLKRTFSLDKASRVLVYAIGEGMEGKMYDYAWLEDTGTGKPVWEMKLEQTEHAGGSKKNRFFRGILALPPGDYTVRYQSDATHSFEKWNSVQPYDVEGWGVRVVRLEDE